mmetsp:Transcript_5437/g.8922  ORF Transcript_5437/g.8922 Transcript_5437/m.8922 type:complete len:467 (+) Transcript_5437:83-1483(+)
MMLASSSQRLISRRLLPTAAATASTLDYYPSSGLRYYHATQKKEILPLIAGLGILFIGRYSWKASQRMNDEWSDYQWMLQQYERRHGVVSDKNSSNNNKYPDGTLAIDIGTFYLKLAKDKSVLVNREGARVTFGGTVVDGEETLIGQRAFEKFYEMQQSNPDNVSLGDPKSIPTVVQTAVTDALERANADLSKIRPIITVPPLKWDGYEAAFQSIFPGATLVPEPVAAIWGAQAEKDLPDHVDTPILVIDIGGLETTLSVVQKNVIVSTTTIETIGGDLYVQAVVDHVGSMREAVRQDGMALQRVYQAAHTAVAELNSQTHAQLHIPYIGMNLETKEPEHLDERVARTVVEQKVLETILSTIDPSKLSTHMPPPTSLSFLWMSILTQLLEVTDMTPMQLSHVLVVGGGAKHAMMEASVKECFVTLQGNSDNVVCPDARLEAIALGAASMLPNYQYDTESGLVRDEE